MGDRDEVEESISVSIRIRPLSESERQNSVQEAWKVTNEDTVSAKHGPYLSHRFGNILFYTLIL